MGNTTQFMIVTRDKGTASSISSKIDTLADTRSYVAERKNLDGVSIGIILLAMLAIKALPDIFDYIAEHIELSTVQSIKVGEIEIRDPSSADVEDLKRYYFAKDAQEG